MVLFSKIILFYFVFVSFFPAGNTEVLLYLWKKKLKTIQVICMTISFKNESLTYFNWRIN